MQAVPLLEFYGFMTKQGKPGELAVLIPKIQNSNFCKKNRHYIENSAFRLVYIKRIFVHSKRTSDSKFGFVHFQEFSYNSMSYLFKAEFVYYMTIA